MEGLKAGYGESESGNDYCDSSPTKVQQKGTT
jgi:hypothetical protein